MIIQDTIIAPATPSGRGGVAIVRLSGPETTTIVQQLIQRDLPNPRYAQYGTFFDEHEEPIDVGITLFFPSPHSFTGEDVVELHCHGGPVIVDQLLERGIQLGARLANPGEFSERAFLNGRMDLVQAEAVADLIDSVSKQAARSAVRSLQGAFSEQISALMHKLTKLRVYVEAALDFSEEEIDFLSDIKIAKDVDELINDLRRLLQQTQQGALLRDGITIVIAGPPNAGKSTLLNCLSGRESAIVTNIPGTTRDIMREAILIDGIPVHVLDTAGLRHSDDLVELEGIKRAQQAIKQADLVLFVVDVAQIDKLNTREHIPQDIPITLVVNKIDLADKDVIFPSETLTVSAKTGRGIEALRQHVKTTVGFSTHTAESSFIARQRHVIALNTALTALLAGQNLLQQASELLAEELRQAQQALGEIIGVYTVDDLLGDIFSSFCVGK